MTICERSNSADTKVREEGGEAGIPEAAAKTFLQPMVMTMVETVELQVIHAGYPTGSWQPMVQQVTHGTPAGDWGDPGRSRSLARICGSPRDARWSSLFLNDCPLWKGAAGGQFLKNCCLWEGHTLDKFVRDCLPWGGPYAGAREECEEKRMTENKRYEPTTSSIPHLPVLLRGGDRRLGSEFVPGKKGRNGQKVLFRFFPYLSLFHSD